MKWFAAVILFLTPTLAGAAGIDTDSDGIFDDKEISVYLTDPSNIDTDSDGFSDINELTNGYSPIVPGKRLIEVDTDADGLNDGYELALGSRLDTIDTDGDGFSDGQEFNSFYSPTSTAQVKLPKSIHIDLSAQRLAQYIGPVRIGYHVISSGKAATPTPTGEFAIQNKLPRPFSRLAGLWMPYWMSFNGPYGMHELPEWPGGIKEGANHLGTPVSHGCVRLSHESAKALYDWAPVGTKVVITN